METLTAAATLIGIIILFRSRQSLSRQRDLLIRDLHAVGQLNRQLNAIVSAHGCAPRALVNEGTKHWCAECGTTWEAQPVEITWLDDGLKNKMTQSWQLTSQE